MKLIRRLLTKNATAIPLLSIYFDLNKYLENPIGSCDVVCHPCFKDDQVLKDKLFNVIDYIRENYDMESIL